MFDGPINGEPFCAHVEHVLVPALREATSSSWTTSAATKARRPGGCAAPATLFFLPCYSPDLNSVEQVLAKFKHLLRKAAARSKETVRQTIGMRLERFTPEECGNDLTD